MTVEMALAICVAAAFACYLVWQWQEAAVDNMADPPYQPPVVDATPVAKEDIQAAWPFPHSRKP